MSPLKKLSFKKITERLNLSEYDPQNTGDYVHVWVNLTKAMHDRWNEIQVEFRKHELAHEALDKQIKDLAARSIEASEKEKKKLQIEIDQMNEKAEEKIEEINSVTAKKMYAWYAEVWSQHADKGTHISGDEVEEAAEMMKVNDVAMWAWITQATQGLILLHNNKHLKALAPPR